MIGPGTSMPSWPIAIAASSVAVTLPSEKPASFFGPIEKPDREREEQRELRVGPQSGDEPVPHGRVLRGCRAAAAQRGTDA